MWWKKNKNEQKEDLQIVAPLILNSQSQMAGDFIIHTDVKIDGTVQGNVTTTKSVIIGQDGHLKGKLKCKSLVVFGTFEGISEISESTSLQATSRFCGKLTSPVISILPGCLIDASINKDQENTAELESENHTIPLPAPRNDKKSPVEPDTKGHTQENKTPPKEGSFLFSKLNNK